MGTFTELSLFSGAGGGLLATQHILGWRTVCYVEWDKYAIDILKARIADGYLDDAPIWDDAFTFDGCPWAGLVDVITAGFPCQPFSNAGKGLAENDPRNGWPAVIRIIREVQPRYAFLENVPGLLSKPYFRRILGELAEAGYDIEHDCVSAEEIGANHKRERLWIVAHATSRSIELAKLPREKSFFPAWDGQTQHVAYTNSERCQEFNSSRVAGDAGIDTGSFDPQSNEVPNSKYEGDRRRITRSSSSQETRDLLSAQWWAVEPQLGRVADGVAHRVDRLSAIGNGQVPAVAARAWELLGEDVIQ